MTRFSGFSGLVGAILLLFAGLGYFITRQLSLFVLAHLLFGVAGVASYLIFSKETLGSFLGQRSTKYGASALAYSLLFFAILVLLNFLSARHYHRFDLTEAGVHSLAPQSLAALSALDQPIEINAFVEAGADPALRELLGSYAYASDKVAYKMIDPDRRPDLAERFSITTVPTIQVQYGDRTNVIARISEEELTNAIIKVARAEAKTVYFLEGHGEPDIDDLRNARGYGQFKTALENEGYTIRKLVLSSDTPVPTDANLLIVAGPDRSLLEHEIQALDAYLKNGGPTLILLKPQSSPELVTYLQNWGVDVGDDVIVDEQIQLLRGRTFTLTPYVSSYGSHPITQDLSKRGSAALTTYGVSRSVSPSAERPKGITSVGLVETGPNSWAETDLAGVFQNQTVQLDEKDRKGPVSLAVAVTANLKEMGQEQEEPGRMVIFGDAVFANNQYLGQYFNRDLVLNTVSWLVGEEGLISIRPRTITASRVQITPDQWNAIFYLSVLVLPEFLLIAGLAAWWRRR